MSSNSQEAGKQVLHFYGKLVSRVYVGIQRDESSLDNGFGML